MLHGSAFLLLLPVVLFDFLCAPFRDFTFTDPSDFLSAGLIVLTVTALAVQHRRWPYPISWVRFASAAAFVLAVLAPFVPLVVLYLLSHRAETLIGHWPRPLVDDPKYIGADDPAYRSLSRAFVYASAFAGWGLFTWGALLFHLRCSLTAARLRWLMGVFLAAWIVFLCEPGGRYIWWLD